MAEDREAAERAYQAAVELVERAQREGARHLIFDADEFRALDRIPPGLEKVKGLVTLDFDRTAVSDLSPLAALTRLQTLSLDQTAVSDLSPLAALTGLRTLSLDRTAVSDLRPIRDLEELGKGALSSLRFSNTPATARDPELARLAGIDNNAERIKQTLAYLKTLPPWPEPLPWEVDAARQDAPAPDPSLPLVMTAEGIALGTTPIDEDELQDPLRGALHEVLAERTADLIRVAGNIDEAAYRSGCRLRDLLEPGLNKMDPLRVHLAVEALRRVGAGLDAGADRDLQLAVAAVVEIGPGLTLDTKPVELLLDRARRNRMERRSEAEDEAQIRLAQSISESRLSAPDLRDFAALSAERGAETQFTATRPTLTKNWIVALGVGAFNMAGQGITGQLFSDYGIPWLAAHADDIRLLAASWGESFPVWIAPILERAQVMVEAAKQAVHKLKNKN